jgi:hypothetical protein
MANVKIPNVTGQRAAAAIARVSAAGFHVTTSPARNPAHEYKVTGTTPSGSAPRGAAVTLHVRDITPNAPSKAKAKTSTGSGAGTSGGAGLPADTTALPPGVTGGGGVAGGQMPGADAGTGGGAGAVTSGGAANTSTSTTAPDNATQQATAADDQTDYAAFFSSGTGPASMYDATQASAGSGGPASAADATAPGASGAPQ